MLALFRSRAVIKLLIVCMALTTFAPSAEAGNRIKIKGSTCLIPGVDGGGNMNGECRFPVKYRLTANEETGRVRFIAEGNIQNLSRQDIETALMMNLDELFGLTDVIEELVRVRISVNKQGKARLVAVFFVDPSILQSL